ncbi:hypothetical protein JCM3765_005696 [Sporobolomyces pararoseus]
MLNSARKSSTNACKACARLAATSSSSSSSCSIRFIPTTSTRSITSTTLNRYNASFAQFGQSIKLDELQEEEEQAKLIEQEPTPQSLEQQDDLSSPTIKSSIPSSLDELIASSSSPSSTSPPSSDEPTLSDLYSFTPRRFQIPSATSPESHRTIYLKTWQQTFNRLSKAFSKRQLYSLCTSKTPFGLELDLEGNSKELQSKLRLGTKGRKPKWWKPKKFEQMNKRELITTILVVHWNMVDPDTLPSRIEKGFTPIVEKVIEELNDKTLFLLLSPNCQTIPRITNHLQVKVSFERHPITRNLTLILKGSKTGVMSAKQEIESIDELTEKRVIKLPKQVTSLRPQVYQTVSKLAKTFLEPLEESKTLLATAIESKALIRLNRYLNSVFAIDHIRQSISLFVSLPTTTSSQPNFQYFFSPYQPLTPSQTPAPLASLSGTTSNFSRLRTLNTTTNTTTTTEEEGKEEDLSKWSEKMKMMMKMESNTILSIRTTGETSISRGNGDGSDSIFKALMNPFKNDVKELGGGGGKFELRAEFGHLVFPLYPSSSSSEQGNEFEPMMKTRSNWEKTLNWLKSNLGEKNQTVWIPCAPKGLLNSTGVDTTSSILSGREEEEASSSSTSRQSPFSSLFSDYHHNPSSSSSSSIIEQIKKFPRFESKNFRRLIYYPIQLPTSTSTTNPSTLDTSNQMNTPPIRLEITLKTPDSSFERGGIISSNSDGGKLVEAKLISESKVDIFKPIGEKDLRLKLRQTKILKEEELELLENGSFKIQQGSTLFETLSQSPSTSPFELNFSPSSSSSSSSSSSPQTFFLHSTSLLRQTKISPPISPPPNSDTLESQYSILQEESINFLPEQGTKYKSFELLLTNGEEIETYEILNGRPLISGEGEEERGWEWKKVLEELEKKCR